MSKCKLPTDAVIAITYKCNARCQMCDIWQMKNYAEISAAEYLKLPPALKDINISGGEPFLRKDIVKVVKNIKTACPRAKLIISSNGLASELIKTGMKKILAVHPHMGIAISIDGINQVHDKIRGIENAFDKALNTLSILKNLGMKNLKIAFTLTNDNLHEMKKVYDLSQKLGVEFTLSAMQNSDIYFGNKQNVLKVDNKNLKKIFDYIIKNELKSWQPKKWVRAYFTYGLYQFIIRQNRELPVEAGNTHFFLDPQGNIYPSVVDSQLMGNLAQAKNFAQIWRSGQNEKLRQDLKNGLAKPSWMICTTRTAIKKHFLKVGWWVVRNKLL